MAEAVSMINKALPSQKLSRFAVRSIGYSREVIGGECFEDSPRGEPLPRKDFGILQHSEIILQ